MRKRLFLQSISGHIARPHISMSEGERMVENGQAARIVRLVKGRYELVGFRMRQALRADHSSPTAITCAEMMAYAGMGERDAITAAQAKVNEWPILTADFRAAMTVQL